MFDADPITFVENLVMLQQSLFSQIRSVLLSGGICKRAHAGSSVPPPPVKNPCIKRTGLKGTRSNSKVRYLQESFTNILSCDVFNQNNK